MGNRGARPFVRHAVRRQQILPSVLMVLAAISVFVNPRAASACSCGPPPPLVAFEGMVRVESGLNGLSGRDYDFRVDKVVAGDVRSPETVRVVTSDSRSSCAVGPRLIVGGHYRVSAYVSTAPDGPRLLYVTDCGGNAELLAAPASSGPAPTSTGDSDGGASDSIAPLLAAAAGVAGLSAGAILWRRRRR
jgi:hypothetical protein